MRVDIMIITAFLPILLYRFLYKGVPPMGISSNNTMGMRRTTRKLYDRAE